MRVHQYTMLCAPHVSQMAAIEALSGPDDDVTAMVADYDRRRRVFVKGLREIGLECPEPGGAFYAFPSIRSSGMDSATFAESSCTPKASPWCPAACSAPPGKGTCAAPTPPRCPCWRRRLRGWTASYGLITVV